MFDPKKHLSGLAFADALADIAQPMLPERAKVLDLGTGTGVLAAALTRVARMVVATDISERAVKDATKNLKGLDVEVRAGDLFEPVWGEWFDLIVVNPPYEVGAADDLTLSSPDMVERFGQQVATYANRALIGWPAEEGDRLADLTGLSVERLEVVPTKGESLGIFGWSAT